jgi:hypothetical protein
MLAKEEHQHETDSAGINYFLRLLAEGALEVVLDGAADFVGAFVFVALRVLCFFVVGSGDVGFETATDASAAALVLAAVRLDGA